MRFAKRPVNSTRPRILGTAAEVAHEGGELVLDTERRVLLRLCRVADGEGRANCGLTDPANYLPSRAAVRFIPHSHTKRLHGVSQTRVTFNVRLPGLDAG